MGIDFQVKDFKEEKFTVNDLMRETYGETKEEKKKKIKFKKSKKPRKPGKAFGGAKLSIGL